MEYKLKPVTEEKYKRIYNKWMNGADYDELSGLFKMKKQSVRTALWIYKEKHNLHFVGRKLN